ncbi:MAG: protein kinase [Acidobacteriota bacterium]|jgi:Tol biopolymer transport system component/tRNA A-37 threonylcarbamoyl transferase component Bud32
MKVPVVGEFLGRYEIVRALGSGAMGQVYAAYDETLAREVALKVLRAQFSDDFERRQRFEREAKAIAALDHPNIVTVYSVEEDNGTHFITMQLVEGKTLDEVVPSGGLSINTFLELAVRLVEAVAAAHRKGIVHRDLKPSNVMVTEDGRLKVLDFGLAKLREDGAEGARVGDPETMGLTLEGQIIGTVAYMSPEQAEGRAADHRSDIFSLGVLLYEMATGDAPFKGDTPISVMSSIIKDTPTLITRLKPGLPPHLGRIIRTCLAKDPVRRYQTAIDLRNALDDLKIELQTGEFEAPSEQHVAGPERQAEARDETGWPGAVRAGSIAALVIAAMAVGVLWGMSRAGGGAPFDDDAINGQPAPLRLTSQASLAGSPSWSPAGTELVYSSDVNGTMDLWHQEADGRTRLLTSLPGDETDPDWAPDDSSVAYTSDFGNNGIHLISPRGGQSSRLTDFGMRPKWSPSADRIVFEWRGDMYVVETHGSSEPRLLVEDTAGSPHAIWSHDGARVYYWNRTDADVFMVPASGGEPQALNLVPTGQEVAGLAAASDGSFLVLSRGPYGGNKDIWKVPLDADGRPGGDPVHLTWPTTDDVDPAISPDGRRLAYAARRVTRHLWAYDFDPVSARPTGVSQQLTTASDSNYYPSVSADGNLLVWTAHRTSDQGQLYSMRLDGELIEEKVTTVWERQVREIGGAFAPAGDVLLFTSTWRGAYELYRVGCFVECVPTPLTDIEHPVRDVMPSWSPSGDRVVFYSNRSGNWDIWSLMLGNGGEPRRLTDAVTFEMYPSFSPSGRHIAYWTNKDGGGGDIWEIDAESGSNARPLAVSEAQEGWGAWSPDEHWFFFASDRSGSFNIWVQEANVDNPEPFRVTNFAALNTGLPETVLYTKFAVAPGRLIIPVEERSGGLWLLQDISR